MEDRERSINTSPCPVTPKWRIWHSAGNMASIFLETETTLGVYFLAQTECEVL